MNELSKYRAWLKEHEEMRKVRSIVFDETYRFEDNLPPHVVVEGWCDIFPFDEVELMQSTGTKDKNSVDIFAEDILHCTNNTNDFVATVIFADGKWQIKGKHKVNRGTKKRPKWKILEDYDDLFSGQFPQFKLDYEIIGNTKEHPHLLEQELADEE